MGNALEIIWIDFEVWIYMNLRHAAKRLLWYNAGKF